jgi:two-component system OmpR family response regulator
MTTLMNAKVAIVEDDSNLREEIAHFLKNKDFEVFEANSGLSLDDLLLTQHIDVVILDLNLPGQSGFDIASRIRKHMPHMGIVMLTARTGSVDRLHGYEAGADIYLPKPTPPQELLAAINNLLRRLQNQQAVAQWSFDSQRRHLYTINQAEPITLTGSEAAMLLALIQAPNKTLESDTLCEIINQHKNSEPITKRALENLVSRLRKKISERLIDDSEPTIRSVWGLGYQLALTITVHKQATH